MFTILRLFKNMWTIQPLTTNILI